MFFSPSPRRRRQLQISERRLLIALGDIVAVIVAVLIALRVWTIVAGYEFSFGFILSQTGWFVGLLAVWLLLASANDFYDLRASANPLRATRRLLVITVQTWIIYVGVFFISPPLALPRLFIWHCSLWLFPGNF